MYLCCLLQNAAFLFTSFKKVDLYYAEAMLRREVKEFVFDVEGEKKLVCYDYII